MVRENQEHFWVIIITVRRSLKFGENKVQSRISMLNKFPPNMKISPFKPEN